MSFTLRFAYAFAAFTNDIEQAKEVAQKFSNLTMPFIKKTYANNY